MSYGLSGTTGFTYLYWISDGSLFIKSMRCCARAWRVKWNSRPFLLILRVWGLPPSTVILPFFMDTEASCRDRRMRRRQDSCTCRPATYHYVMRFSSAGLCVCLWSARNERFGVWSGVAANATENDNWARTRFLLLFAETSSLPYLGNTPNRVYLLLLSKVAVREVSASTAPGMDDVFRCY